MMTGDFDVPCCEYCRAPMYEPGECQNCGPVSGDPVAVHDSAPVAPTPRTSPTDSLVAKFDQRTGLLTLTWRTHDKSVWADILADVKALPGRAFLPTKKAWTIPNSEEARNRLLDIGFVIEGVHAPCDTPMRPQEPTSTKTGISPWVNEKVPETRYKGLRAYQMETLKRFQWQGGRLLIGDEMGTGKTCQAISILRLDPAMRPALIVVPAITKPQWVRQWEMWNPDEPAPEILEGETPWPLDPSKSYVINWDILQRWSGEVRESVDGKKLFRFNGELSKIPFRAVIGDEIQAIGNPSSNRAKAFKALARRAEWLVEMSGTPYNTKVRQLWLPLHLLAPDVFPNEYKFKMRYCDPKHTGFGWNYDGTSNAEELRGLIDSVMIRRLKRDVMAELPEISYDIVEVPLSPEHSEEYRTTMEALADSSGVDFKEAEELADRLQQTAFFAKAAGIMQWVHEFLASGEKLILFTYHRAAANMLCAEFPDALRIDGSVLGTKRSAILGNFRDSNGAQMIVLQMLSGGVGLDGLQDVCSYMAFVEFVRSPTVHAQAEARLHRSGQNNAVTAYYLAGSGAEADLAAAEILVERRKTQMALLDGEEIEERNFLAELVRRIGGKLC